MALPCIVRVDSRLIHGQVLKAWVRELAIEHISIVDDKLAHDAFLTSIYMISVPKGTTLSIHTVDEAVARWPEDIAAHQQPWMLLFGSLEHMIAAWHAGMRFPAVQIAGRGKLNGRRTVYEGVSLSEEDVRSLQPIHAHDVNILFQSTPDQAAVAFDEVLRTDFAHLVPV